VGATNNVRREFNQAFFEALFVGVDGVQRAEFRPPFAQLRDFTIGLEDDDSDELDDKARTTGTKNPCKTKRTLRPMGQRVLT